MRITYRLVIEDYYDAAQARSKRNRRIGELAALAMAVVIGLALIRAPDVQGGHKYLSLGLALLILFALLPASRWMEKLSFKHALKNGGDNRGKELTVNISEKGIQTLDPPQNDDWSRFSKYSESASSFILYQQDAVYTILPKRAFDPEGINSLRQILAAKLPKY